MEDINVELKPKKKNLLSKIKSLFEDKKKRGLYVVLFILPFLILIGIFGYVTYREAKNLLSLVTGNNEIQDEYRIDSMGYILRTNATDYQFEQFTEMKNAIETGSADEQTIAGMVAKNYVIDFYTWTNKQGQYDVGGMYYLYDGEYIDGTDFKENAFLKARTGFYKYLNTYIKTYGANNLLEVNSVNVLSSQKVENMIISEHIANKQDENGDWYDYREDIPYETYKVTCSWTYKPTDKFDTSSYATKMNFLVIKQGERFAITAASENEIEVNSEVEEKDIESESDVEDIQEEE